MRVLFICKHNRFRSKVAEAFFNKYNKNKKITASSAGLGKKEPPIPYLIKIIMKFRGAPIKNQKSRHITDKIIKKTNLIVNVAEDIPNNYFKKYRKKVLNWKILDVFDGNPLKLNNRISQIDKKVLNLVNELIK